MLVGSLLLILVAVATLGLGLVQGSNAFLVGSIAASLLAAVVLVVWARRAVTLRSAPSQDAYDGLGDDESPPSRAETPERSGEPVRRRDDSTVYGREPAARVEAEPGPGGVDTGDEPEPVGIASQHDGRVQVELELDLDEELDSEDPLDEPAAQIVAPADAARVARMSAQVLVIDGRPRYHQAGCVHLLGRESEALPVNEAVELGFTPCSLCEPDSALLADARRV